MANDDNFVTIDLGHYEKNIGVSEPDRQETESKPMRCHWDWIKVMILILSFICLGALAVIVALSIHPTR